MPRPRATKPTPIQQLLAFCLVFGLGVLATHLTAAERIGEVIGGFAAGFISHAGLSRLGALIARSLQG